MGSKRPPSLNSSARQMRLFVCQDRPRSLTQGYRLSLEWLSDTKSTSIHGEEVRIGTHLEVAQARPKLPNVKLEWIVWIPGQDLLGNAAKVLLRKGKGGAQRQTDTSTRVSRHILLKVHGGLEIVQEDTRSGDGELARSERFWEPLDEKVVQKRILINCEQQTRAGYVETYSVSYAYAMREGKCLRHEVSAKAFASYHL